MDTLPGKFIGVSFKMYFDHEQTLAWSHQIREVIAGKTRSLSDTVVAIFPLLPSIQAVKEVFSGFPVALGAQNVADHEKGPFTGEVSAAALAQLGCLFVEIGHAERRRIFSESDAMLTAKLAVTYEHGMVPLLCVGEMTKGSAAEAGEYCSWQIARTFGALPENGPIIIAYEPVWAIGAPAPAGSDHIIGVCQVIREWFECNRPATSARIVYGGSAGVGLFPQLSSQVDGLFLGRFAHDPIAYASILDDIIAG
jgi:triosephosphate isomerase